MHRERAIHAQINSSRNIMGTVCDGCRCMCVITRGRRIPVEEYWCDHKHMCVDPYEVECAYGNRGTGISK